MTWTVHVLPAPHPPKPPPVAKINPSEYELRLPDTHLILTADPDDDQLTYHWSIKSGSIATQSQLGSVNVGNPQLIMDVADEPDNIVFVLTITDDQNQTSTAEAIVTVQEEIDEPPIADAGEGVSYGLKFV